jgi:hypothetical protein
MPEQEQPIESKIKQTANGIAAAIDEALNPDGKKEWGFALLMFRLGDNREGDRMNYISNAKRDGMLAAMKEFIARNEGTYIENPMKRRV